MNQQVSANVLQGIGEEIGALFGIPSASQVSRLQAQRSLNAGGLPFNNPNTDPWNILAALKQQQPSFQNLLVPPQPPPQFQNPWRALGGTPLTMLGAQEPQPFSPLHQLLGQGQSNAGGLGSLASLFGKKRRR